MIKWISLVAVSAACFVKLSITSFSAQMDYPGIRGAAIIVNYTAKIENPKEHEITVEGIWVKGRWINLNKDFSGNPITIRASVKYINTDTLSNKTPSPTKNKNDKAAIKYKLKGKSKTRYIGIGKINKEESIARP